MTKFASGWMLYRLIAAGALAVAMLFASVVTVIYLRSADDGAEATVPAASNDGTGGGGLPLAGTPIADIPGMPTPIPNTGPLSPFRPEIGKRAPDFALPAVRDPSSIRYLSEFSGTPLVLNWYANWCDPCREEMPVFQEAQDALGDQVVFYAVNFLESQSEAVKILDDFDITFPAVMDASGAVSDHYRVGHVIPVTMLIDADGILQKIHWGPLSAADLERDLALIGVDYQVP